MKQITLIYFLFGVISLISVSCNNNQPKAISNAHNTHCEKVDSGGSVSKAVNDTTEEKESLKEIIKTELPSENKKTVEPKETVECECKRRFDISENEFISMQITPQKISENTTVYSIMENHTKDRLSYGGFFLEYFSENNWIPVEFNFVFTSLGQFLTTGEIIKNQMDLYSLVKECNNAKKGKYRINRKVVSHSNNGGRYKLCDEFEIE